MTVGIPSTHRKMFLMEGLGFPLKEEMEGGRGRAPPPHAQTFEPPSSDECQPPPKLNPSPFLHVSHRPSPNRRPHIEKKIYLRAITQILSKILLTGHIFSFTTVTHLKSFIGIKLLNTKQCPAGLFSTTRLSKNFAHPLFLVSCLHQVLIALPLTPKPFGKSKR